MMIMLVIVVSMIILVIVMTVKVTFTKYLLPCLSSVLNTIGILLYQVFLTTLRRYFYHPCCIDGEITEVKNLPEVVQLGSREVRI